MIRPILGDPAKDADLSAVVRRALDSNRYLALGTTEPDGTARPEGCQITGRIRILTE